MVKESTESDFTKLGERLTALPRDAAEFNNGNFAKRLSDFVENGGLHWGEQEKYSLAFILSTPNGSLVNREMIRCWKHAITVPFFIHPGIPHIQFPNYPVCMEGVDALLRAAFPSFLEQLKKETGRYTGVFGDAAAKDSHYAHAEVLERIFKDFTKPFYDHNEWSEFSDAILEMMVLAEKKLEEYGISCKAIELYRHTIIGIREGDNMSLTAINLSWDWKIRQLGLRKEPSGIVDVEDLLAARMMPV